MRNALHLILPFVTFNLAMYAAACGSDTAGMPAPLYSPPDVSDVVFEGDADAAALERMLVTPVIDNPLRGAKPDSPPDQSLFAQGAPPPLFTWHIGPTTSSRGDEGWRRTLLPTLASPRRATAWLDALVGERAAWAAQGSFTGDGYLLAFTIETTDTPPKQFAILRVFTSNKSYAPDAAAWAKVVKSGSWVTLTITYAAFADGVITDGGGPFTPQNIIQFCAGG